ncbi:MAG TPA: septal ring lytic transglycosylase RlpA family protein [Xanthobacteraceae bacterium]|jgi:rare lipoprotein A
MAATLAACAQPNVVADRSAPLAGSRQASPEPKRHAAVSATKTSRAATRRAGETREASYGLASFYTHDPHTASGEKFDSREFTAAHPTLPFGTRVRVTNVATGQSVTVRVNDRGPFVPGRVVDVSRGAAESLGIADRGVAKVKLDVVE